MHKVIGPRILSKRTQSMELYGPSILSEGQLTHKSSVKEVSLVLAEVQSKTKKLKKTTITRSNIIGRAKRAPHCSIKISRDIYSVCHGPK